MRNLDSGDRLISVVEKFADLPRSSQLLSYAGFSALSGVITELAHEQPVIPVSCSLVAAGYLLAAGIVYFKGNPISPKD